MNDYLIETKDKKSIEIHCVKLVLRQTCESQLIFFIDDEEEIVLVINQSILEKITNITTKATLI